MFTVWMGEDFFPFHPEIKSITSTAKSISAKLLSPPKSLCSTHLPCARHVALVLPSPLLLLPPHLSEGLQIWDACLFSPPLLSCGGFIPIQPWSLGWQREGELMPPWQGEPRQQWIKFGCLANLKSPQSAPPCWLAGQRGGRDDK